MKKQRTIWLLIALSTLCLTISGVSADTGSNDFCVSAGICLTDTGVYISWTVSTWATNTWLVTGNSWLVTVYTWTEFQQALKRMFANWLTSYGTETGYRPADFLTRQEAAKIVWQAYTVLWYVQEIKNTNCAFSDASLVDSTLKSHVSNVCKRWLFKGTQGYSPATLGKFMPTKSLTRPEIMAVLVRMFEWSTSFESISPRRSEYYLKGKAIRLTTVSSQTAFDSPITRQEMAIYIYRLRNIVIDQAAKANALNVINQLNQTGSDSSQLATDFSALAGSISVDKDPELLEAIRWMNDNGLTNYTTIQDYLPFAILTREQAAKILYSFSEVFDFVAMWTNTDCTFTDISTADESLVNSIENACRANIMKGTNGKFMPKTTIKKSEFVTAMIRMFEGKKLDETWTPRRKNYFQKAQDMGIVSPADAITFEQPITRYEVALFLYRFKVKYQMLNALNSNKLNNEIINTVPGSITTGSNNLLESDVYIDMNSIENGNFDVGYIEIFGTRYKIVKSSTEKYFSDNFVRYGDVFDIDNDDKIGTMSLIVSNGYTIEWTIRLPDHDYLISQLTETNAYYQIKQIK